MLRGVLWCAVALVTVAALWLALRPPPAALEPVAPRTDTLELRYVLASGQVHEGEADVRVQQGQPIRLIVHGDRADELHVHGYELSATVSPEAPAHLEFVADTAGRFEIELHARHVTLLTLTVSPP